MMKELFNPAYVLDNVLPAVVPTRENEAIYYEPFLDLFVEYYIPFGEFEDKEAYMHLTTTFIEHLQIDKDELRTNAIANITENATIQSIDEVLCSALDVKPGDTPPTPMLVVSTKTMQYGSGCFLSHSLLDKAAKQLNTNTVGVIPSSKEELILIDFDEDLREEYNGIINKVNETVGDKYLSNHIYTYSTDTQTVCC